MSSVWIHRVFNVLVPLTTLIALFFIFPVYLVFKLLDFVKRCICSENLSGKVVLVTGASSGIGEYLGYEYARRGARLALVARREDRLQEVAAKARELGSPEVLVIPSDVAKIEDCRSFVDQTFKHFGRLNHLVNNAGVLQSSFFEDITKISDFRRSMSTNFWGSVYAAHFAVPYLKESKGRMVIVSSAATWSPTAKASFYNASKAAMTSFFDTLRVEFGSDIGVTMAIPGLIDSELLSVANRNNFEKIVLPASSEGCAKAIVRGACRGQTYVSYPYWSVIIFMTTVLCPELIESILRFLTITGPQYFPRQAEEEN